MPITDEAIEQAQAQAAQAQRTLDSTLQQWRVDDRRNAPDKTVLARRRVERASLEFTARHTAEYLQDLIERRDRAQQALANRERVMSESGKYLRQLRSDLEARQAGAAQAVNVAKDALVAALRAVQGYNDLVRGSSTDLRGRGLPVEDASGSYDTGGFAEGSVSSVLLGGDLFAPVDVDALAADAVWDVAGHVLGVRSQLRRTLEYSPGRYGLSKTCSGLVGQVKTLKPFHEPNVFARETRASRPSGRDMAPAPSRGSR